MKILNLFVAAISCLIVGASSSYPIKQCVNSLYDDSVDFGSYVALNKRYLAVGDSSANYVVIYTRNNFGKWIRIKELSPPKDSVFSKIGKGFGGGLQLDENVLVINAFSQELISGTTSHKTFYGRYLIRLDSETEVQTLDLPVEKTQGLVQLNLLSEGEIKQMTLPDNQEIAFKESFGFGSNVAFDNNLLLVGFTSYPEKRRSLAIQS
ncbi:MAG: hypothetical protein QNJ34_02290 [Xenococcaceae cyanobacterium MO_188.B29]|nr:hypothetical protein [Xenococcaceae cyanobacterium MO_188.B29]